MITRKNISVNSAIVNFSMEFRALKGWRNEKADLFCFNKRHLHWYFN